jgi:biotin synthase-related radical SAM superfamily protein
MVPKAVQDLIWAHYRRGQEIDKEPSLEYIVTAFVSISCVALKENKPLPSFMTKAPEGEQGL